MAKPRSYHVSIRKDLNHQSRGLTSGGILPAGGQSVANGGVYDYRYCTIVTDTLQDAMSIARSLCGKGEEVHGISLQDEEVIVDPNIDIKGD